MKSQSAGMLIAFILLFVAAVWFFVFPGFAPTLEPVSGQEILENSEWCKPGSEWSYTTYRPEPVGKRTGPISLQSKIIELVKVNGKVMCHAVSEQPYVGRHSYFTEGEKEVLEFNEPLKPK